jgi:hypothetical protein
VTQSLRLWKPGTVCSNLLRVSHIRTGVVVFAFEKIIWIDENP